MEAVKSSIQDFVVYAYINLLVVQMKFASQFVVPAAPDKVFALFFDPETMRACIPGCEELRKVDESTYQGSLTNEVAHVKFRAGFTAEIQSVTDPTGPDDTSVVKAILKGEDRRLGSTIKIDATMTVAPQGEDALVSYELEMAMWGKLGRLGEPVIRRRSAEVEKQFAAALTAVCAGEPIPESGGRPRASARASTGSGSDATTASPSEALGTNAQTAPQHDKPDFKFVLALAVAALAVGILVGRRGRKR